MGYPRAVRTGGRAAVEVSLSGLTVLGELVGGVGSGCSGPL